MKKVRQGSIQYIEEIYPGQRGSKCRSTEAGVCLTYSRYKKVRVSGEKKHEEKGKRLGWKFGNQTMGGKGRRKTIAVIQGRKKDDSFMHGISGGIEMCLDITYILKLKPQKF